MFRCQDCDEPANHIVVIPPTEAPLLGQDWRTVAVPYRGEVWAWCDVHIDDHVSDTDDGLFVQMDGHEIESCVVLSALHVIQIVGKVGET